MGDDSGGAGGGESGDGAGCGDKFAGGNFAVINADDFYGAESFEVLARQLDGQVDAHRHDLDASARTGEYAMVGFRLRETLSESGAVARGLCRVNGDGLLESVVEVFNIERNGGNETGWGRRAQVQRAK